MGHYQNFSMMAVAIVLLLTTTASLAEIVLTEGEQVALESAQTLLPDDQLAAKINYELPRIRLTFKNVSMVIHQAKWAAGELLAKEISDAQIEALRKNKKLGLTSVQKFSWGGAHLYFGYPYNPEILGAKLEAEYKFQSNPNVYFFHRTEQISFNAYRNEYLFEHGWGDCARGWPCLYTYYWMFRQDADGYIRLVKEGGEAEPQPGPDAPSDVPQKTDPYTYAPNRKQSIIFGR